MDQRLARLSEPHVRPLMVLIEGSRWGRFNVRTRREPTLGRWTAIRVLTHCGQRQRKMVHCALACVPSEPIQAPSQRRDGCGTLHWSWEGFMRGCSLVTSIALVACTRAIALQGVAWQ
jgi:hypothetical protein